VLSEDDAIAGIEASQMSLDSVVDEIKRLGDNPRADLLQVILDKIADEPSEKKRAMLFTAAKQNLKGKCLKDLAEQAQAMARKEWKARGGTKKSTKPELATSSIPLPSWTLYYAKHENRTFAYGTGEDGLPDIPLHSPLQFRSALIYPDRKVQGREPTQGVNVEFEDVTGEIKALPFTRADALRAPKEGMIADLVNAGVGFTPTGIKAFQNGILAGGALAKSGMVFDAPGWRGEDFFLTPGGEVIGETNRDIGLASSLSGISRIGTLEAWRNAVAAAFDEEVIAKAPHVPATVLLGFCSPLIDRAQEEMSMILSIAGRTSTLKTFALRLMASVWGSVEPTDGLLTTFSATANRLEECAINRSGSGLAIDESTLIKGDELGAFAYRIVTGAERGRKGETARHWRIACALTSEVPIAQLMRAACYEPPPGLMSRVVEIPTTGERVSDEPVDVMRAAAFNYGHAGPVFVRAMLAEGYDREKIAAEIAQRVYALIGGTGEREQERRASRAIAYIGLAGEIAQRAGLVPESFDVNAFVMRTWEACRGGANTTLAVVSRINHVLSTGLRDGTIPIYSQRGDALATGGCGAVCFQTFGNFNDPVFVLPSATLAKMIGTRETPREAAKILDDAGALYREQDDRLAWRAGRAGVGNIAAYVIYARVVLGEDADEVIEGHRHARAPISSASPALRAIAGGLSEADAERIKYN
jgi:putative DNA primase/helicase